MDNCVVCGKPKGRNKYCCSVKCFAEYRKHWKQCIICGKWFSDPHSNRTKCCSPNCSKIHRVNMGKSSIFEESVRKMSIAKETFYREHSGEKDVNSKYWVLQSPTGQIYSCQNLFHFFRQHPDLIPGSTPRQAITEISHIKAILKGTRKIGKPEWKGWRLLDWNDERLADIHRKGK